ncbi:AI-2E family transporter [Patescibacteria group bacterium]|nr:AI-2E family transporter [Patescibacteria group bacterium]
MNNNHLQTVSISSSTIIRLIVILLGLIFIYLIRDILLIVVVSVIIATAATGPVNWLQNRRVPRLLGVIFIYLLLLLLLASVIALVFPLLSEQVRQLSSNFPGFLEKINLNLREWWGGYQIEGNLQSFLSQVGSKISDSTSSVFSTIVSLFGGIFSAAVILVISFYLTVQEKGIKRFFISLTPQNHQQYVSDLIERIEAKIGGWLRGQLLLMLIVGLLVYLGLTLLGVKYALTLALIAGILEIVPYVGPIISAVPGIILAFLQAPVLGFLVFILYVVVQQLENYIILPQVMKKTVGLNPIVIIIAMLIGAKLAGVLGIILSVPLTAAITEFVKDFKE